MRWKNLNISKNKNGFTLVELIIVVAVIAVVSAIIIPNFTDITQKSKLKSDIVSARVIQNAIDVYTIENGSVKATNGTADETDLNAIITALYSKKYLKVSTYSTQTDGTTFIYHTEDKIVKVNLPVTSKAASYYKDLSNAEKAYIEGTATVAP